MRTFVELPPSYAATSVGASCDKQIELANRTLELENEIFVA